MSLSTMEERKTQTQQVEKVSTKKAFTYLEEIKSEFKKVTWTSREELIVYTKVVVAFTFFFGMAVYFTDVFIHQFMVGLNNAIRWITG